MELRVAGIENESIVDGPGFRLAVFAQGCPHHCPGCHNPQTHPFEGGTMMDVGSIADMLEGNPLLRGVTLSGGEPFCQPEAMAQLAALAHERGKDVVCYTGYTLEQLLAMDKPAVRSLLGEIDILVDGPYIEAQRDLTLLFRGSSNQRLIDLPATLASGEVRLWSDPYWDGD